MNKLLISLTLVAVLMFSIVGVLAAVDDDTQDVTATVDDIVVISVTPPTLDFPSVPLSASTDVSGSTVSIDASASETASGTVDVTVAVSGTDQLFFEALLEFDIDGGPTWTDVTGLGTLVIADDSSMNLPSRLFGDSTSFGPGSKSAVITYTASGTPP
jgi:hypothetical protein